MFLILLRFCHKAALWIFCSGTGKEEHYLPQFSAKNTPFGTYHFHHLPLVEKIGWYNLTCVGRIYVYVCVLGLSNYL